MFAAPPPAPAPAPAGCAVMLCSAHTLKCGAAVSAGAASVCVYLSPSLSLYMRTLDTRGILCCGLWSSARFARIFNRARSLVRARSVSKCGARTSWLAGWPACMRSLGARRSAVDHVRALCAGGVMQCWIRMDMCNAPSQCVC